MLEGINTDAIDMRKFWKQSFVAALISQRIANEINFPQPDTIYTAGLLMFIGDLIEALLPEHIDISHIANNELAAAQLEQWGFPYILIEAIRHFKRPSESSDQYALPTSIIHLCYCILVDDHEALDEDALQVTYLTKDEILHISDDINRSVLLQ